MPSLDVVFPPEPCVIPCLPLGVRRSLFPHLDSESLIQIKPRGGVGLRRSQMTFPKGTHTQHGRRTKSGAAVKRLGVLLGQRLARATFPALLWSRAGAYGARPRRCPKERPRRAGRAVR